MFSPTPAGLTWTVANGGTVGGDDDTYSIVVTLETDGYTNSGSDIEYLSAYSLSLSTGALDDVTLFSSPAGFLWTSSENVGISGGSSKCSGEEVGTACVGEDSELPGLALSTNGFYSWTFHVDLGAAGFSSLTTLEVGISTLNRGGNWVPKSDFTATTGSLELEDVETGSPTDPLNGAAPVPEPTGLVLLGTGLVLAANRMRRRT